MARTVLIAGGNKGDKESLSKAARELIAERIGEIKLCSSIHRSKPWGFECKEEFWNQVFEVETTLSPFELLESIHQIEHTLGRERELEKQEKLLNGQPYASRTMDIDILLYDEITLISEELQIPHPRLAEREFVLNPLCEIMPDRLEPCSGVTMRELKQRLISEQNLKV